MLKRFGLAVGLILSMAACEPVGQAVDDPTPSPTPIELDFDSAVEVGAAATIQTPEGMRPASKTVGPSGVAVKFENHDPAGPHRLDYFDLDGVHAKTLFEWTTTGARRGGGDPQPYDYWDAQWLGRTFAVVYYFAEGTANDRVLHARVDLRTGERVSLDRFFEPQDLRPPLTPEEQHRELFVWSQSDVSDDLCVYALTIEPVAMRQLVCARDIGTEVVFTPTLVEGAVLFAAGTPEVGGGVFEMPLSGGRPVEVVPDAGTSHVVKIGDAYLFSRRAWDDAGSASDMDGVFLFQDGRMTRVETAWSHTVIACGRWAVWVGGGQVRALDPDTGDTANISGPDRWSTPSGVTCHGRIVAATVGDVDAPVQLFELPA